MVMAGNTAVDNATNPLMAKQFLEMLQNSDPATRAKIGQMLGFSPTASEKPTRDLNAEARNFVRAFGNIVRPRGWIPMPPDGIAGLDPGFKLATENSPIQYTVGGPVDIWLQNWQQGKFIKTDKLSIQLAEEAASIDMPDAELIAQGAG